MYGSYALLPAIDFIHITSYIHVQCITLTLTIQYIHRVDTHQSSSMSSMGLKEKTAMKKKTTSCSVAAMR